MFVKPLPKGKVSLISKAITNFIEWDLYPLNLVSGMGFQSLMKLLEPRYIIPHRTTFMRTHIPEAYNEMKAQVKSELQESTRICLTTDLWTGDYKHCSYMGVTAHFIND